MIGIAARFGKRLGTMRFTGGSSHPTPSTTCPT